jgi:hypothetical protein
MITVESAAQQIAETLADDSRLTSHSRLTSQQLSGQQTAFWPANSLLVQPTAFWPAKSGLQTRPA